MHPHLADSGARSAVPRFETLWLRPDANADATACVTPAGVISRAEFRARVDALAASLTDSDRAVLLACEDTLHFALGFCAALRAGREILLPPNLQADTLADTALASAERLDDAIVARERPHATLPPAAFNPAHPITLFTSGSTGAPKRIAKTLRQLSAETETLEARFGALLGGAYVTATVPHIHIYGMLFRALWPLMAGRPFVVEAVLGSNLSRARDHALVSSPAFLRRIEPADFAPVRPRVIFSSGGRLPETQAAALANAARCPLVEVYGSTETGGIAWREWLPDVPHDGAWTPFDDVALRIDDNRTLNVRSRATGEAWLASGDIATLLPERRFLLDGRADGVIKLEDKRVSLAALNDWLETHAWIAEAHVIALSGARSELGAVLRLNADGERELARQGRAAFSRALRHHVRQRFEAVVAPRRWRYVAELPVNAMGKTTAAALAALFERSAS